MNQDRQRRQLRDRLLARRTALTDAQQRQAGQDLCEQLRTRLQSLPLENPATVAGYLPSRGEIDVLPALDWLRATGSITCVPVMCELDAQPGLRFAPFDSATPMIPGKFNIPVPDIKSSELLSAEQLDLVLVPLTGFDKQGHRLGMGGGYYDRTFAWRLTHKPRQLFIGVAHECQKLPDIPVESWDVPLDAIATDQHWYTPVPEV